MRAEHIDFYLIPTADDHASEYVSDYYKVRNYYAGFTGSAGTLLIGMDMAGLWTDGRYFIQAENQLAGSKIRLFRMGNADEPALFEYLRENLPTGGTLAFDGQVVNLAQGQAYADMLASKQGRVLWDHDLAGSLWRERPSRSSEPVYILDEKYTERAVGRSLNNFGNI
ncbi:MAG: aminopeptidase P family N-terminal domain-containing protein [Frisingicoccus sp.]